MTLSSPRTPTRSTQRQSQSPPRRQSRRAIRLEFRQRNLRYVNDTVPSNEVHQEFQRILQRANSTVLSNKASIP